MKVFNLPDDVFSDKTILDDKIIIYHHAATASIFRERALLHRNAVSLVIQGQKTMHFTEKTIYTNDREIHFLSAGNCIVNADISGLKPFESILIFYDTKELMDFYVRHAEHLDRTRKKYNVKPSSYVAFEKDKFIESYIQSLLLLIKKQGQFTTEMKRIKLQELLLYLLESQPELFLSFQHSAKISQSELKIRKIVEQNIVSNLSLDEMAFLCDLSTSTFKRQFKKIYGTSPNAWILEQRMSLAKQLLTEQRQKPGEIWFKLGFESHTGFTRSFKRHFGVPPKQTAEL